MAGFDPTAVAGNLPGYLQPQYGAIAGVAQGLQSALQGFREARADQAGYAQQALENKMREKSWQLQLANNGLAETNDPAMPFAVSPLGMQRAKIANELEEHRDSMKSFREAQVKSASERGTLLPLSYSSQFGDPGNPYSSSTTPGNSPDGQSPPTSSADASNLSADNGPSSDAQPGLLGGAAPSSGLLNKPQPQGGLISLPGGPSPAFQKAQQDVVNAKLTAQKDAQSIKEQNVKMADPTFSLGQLDKDQIKTEQGRLDVNIPIYQKLQHATSILDDPKQSDSVKLATASDVLSLLKESKTATGQPRMNADAYKEQTRLLEPYRLVGPNIGVGRNYAAQSKVFKSAMAGLRGEINDSRSNIKSIVPQYQFKTPLPWAPPVGTTQNGYRFNGGDPADQKNWSQQ